MCVFILTTTAFSNSVQKKWVSKTFVKRVKKIFIMAGKDWRAKQCSLSTSFPGFFPLFHILTLVWESHQQLGKRKKKSLGTKLCNSVSVCTGCGTHRWHTAGNWISKCIIEKLFWNFIAIRNSVIYLSFICCSTVNQMFWIKYLINFDRKIIFFWQKKSDTLRNTIATLIN